MHFTLDYVRERYAGSNTVIGEENEIGTLSSHFDSVCYVLLGKTSFFPPAMD